MTRHFRALALIFGGLLAASGAVAQTPSVAGQWQCEYASRNIYRTDAHAVYYRAVFNVLPNGAFQAQGHDGSSGNFQAQGQWRLVQDQGRWWFNARGQRTMQMMGVVEFAFDSFLVSATQMALNIQDAASGIEIASQCQRSG